MALDTGNLSFKKLVNRQYTTPNKAWYEEQSGIGFKLKGIDVWVDPIPEEPSSADPSVVQEFNTLTLTEDTTVNFQRTWYCKDGDTKIGDFIPPLYGSGYEVALFDNNDNQIYPTDASDWFFDYTTGILTFGESVSGFTTPFKIKVYRYIGRTADDVASTYGEEEISGNKTFTDDVSVEGEFNTSGGQTINGDLEVGGSGDINGDLHVHGGLTVDSTSLLVQNIECSNDALITGDLTVLGTMTTLSTQDTVIEDNMIILNDGETGTGVTANTSGIEIDRGLATNVRLYFDETDDLWKVTNLDGGTDYEIGFRNPATFILYVDKNRTDAYEASGSFSNPFKTIEAAVNAANSGNVIEILPGTYTENLSINKNLTIRGQGKSNTIIEGYISIAANVNMSDIKVVQGTSIGTINFLSSSINNGSIKRSDIINNGGNKAIHSSNGVLQNVTIEDCYIEGDSAILLEQGSSN